jgi:hypothetical protein
MQFSEQHINTYRDLSVVLLRAGYAESQVAAYVASHPNPTSYALSPKAQDLANLVSRAQKSFALSLRRYAAP